MGMMLLQLGKGFTDLVKPVDMRDRDLEAALLDKGCELGQHPGRVRSGANRR